MNRRAFAQQLAGMVGSSALLTTLAHAGHDRDGLPAQSLCYDAALFDAFALFDPRPVSDLAEQLAPGRGVELMTMWRGRQFEYAWLRVLAGNYADFWRCTEDALRYSVAALRLPLTPAQQDRLVRAHLELKPWPDVPAALHTLRSAGVRLGVLSNFTPAMLEASIRGGGLGTMFEQVLSTDAARTYKPDPRAYQLGIDALRLPRERIVFVAFAGWDAAGATRFGYPTFWANRLQAPPEELGAPAPGAVGHSLAALADFVIAAQAHEHVVLDSNTTNVGCDGAPRE
jgi:2-haloacid dehalogenase